MIDDILADESEPACERLVVHSLSEERVVISFRLTLSVGRAATMCLRYPNYIAVAGSLGNVCVYNNRDIDGSEMDYIPMNLPGHTGSVISVELSEVGKFGSQTR